MTTRHPPRLALWLVDQLGPDDEPLVGDLVEQFEASRSRWWFWRQALGAIAISRFVRAREVRPLRLVDRDPGDTLPGLPDEWHPVNLSASPLPSMGGLGLLTMAVLVSLLVPELWVVVLVAFVLGSVLGVVAIIANRPAGDRPDGGILFHEGADRYDTARQPKARA